MPLKQPKATGAGVSTPATSGASAASAPGVIRSSILSDESGGLDDLAVLLPPDGGYGWVVVTACFLMNLFTDGCLYSFGFYQNGIKQEFQVGAAQMALLPSMCSGFYFLAGPVLCALGNRWGFRVVSVIGSVCASGALASCYFIESYVVFAVVYGVILGTSAGAVYISTTIVVGFYFERWRGLATCLTSCGSGVGVVVLPLCYRALETVEGYHWRWVFLFNSSLLALTASLSLFLRPLKPVTRSERTVRFEETTGKRLRGLRLLRQRGTQTQSPTGPAPLGRTYSSSNLQQIRSSQTSFSPSVRAPQFDAMSILSSRTRGYLESREAQTGPRPAYRDDIFYRASASRLSSQLSSRYASLSAPPPRHPGSALDGEAPTLCARCPRILQHAFANLLDCSLLTNSVFLVFSTAQIFMMLGYFTPFLFIQASTPLLLGDPSNFVTDMGRTGQAEVAGVPRNLADWLLPTLGIANALGRLLAGALSEVPGISAIGLSCGSLTLASVAVAVTCLSYNPAFIIFVVAAFGLLVAPFMSMKSLVLVDFLGLERLTNSFGLSLMFQGFTVMIGPPLNGWIRDLTGTYSYVFLISGASLFLAANLPYLMFPLSIYERQKELQRILQRSI